MWPDTFVLASIRLGKGAGARDKQPASACGCCESDILSVGARRTLTNWVGCAHARRTARANAPAPETSETALGTVDQHDGATPLGNAVCTNRFLPVAAAANRRGPHAPRQYLAAACGMLPARMSVSVVDEHPALHAQKKVDPVPNSAMRAWIHVLPPGCCCDLNVFAAAPPSATTDSTHDLQRPRRWIFSRRRDIRQMLRGRNHTLGKSTLASHINILQYLFFMADYPLLG